MSNPTRLFEYDKYWLVRRSDTPNLHIYWCAPGSRRVRRKSTNTADLDEAKRRLVEFANVRQARPAKQSLEEVPILKLLNDYVETVIENSRFWPPEKTALRHWNEFFERENIVTVAELSLDRQDDYIRWRRETMHRQGHSGSNGTIARELGVVRAAIRSGWKRGLLTTIPYVRSLPPPPARRRFLFQDEVRRLLAACDEPHLWRFCMIALHTLQRPGSILGLSTDQVLFEEGLIDFLPEGLIQTRKRRPVVPISDTIRGVLLEACAESESGFVIEFNGRPVNNVRKAFRSACMRAGIADATPYTLRHTGATLLLASGVPIRQVSGMLGHSEQETTEMYGKHHPSFLNEAKGAVDRLFGLEQSICAPNARQNA